MNKLFMYSSVIVASILFTILIVMNVRMQPRMHSTSDAQTSQSQMLLNHSFTPVVYLMNYVSNSGSLWTFKITNNSLFLRQDYLKGNINTLMINGKMYSISSVSDPASSGNMTLTLSGLCNQAVSFVNCSSSSNSSNTSNSPNPSDKKTVIVIGYKI